MMTNEQMEQMMERIRVNYANDRDVKSMEANIEKVLVEYIGVPTNPKRIKVMVNSYSLLVQATTPQEGII
ncbi:hypothetical protein BWI96_11805 [Siphonobacter sp. SORGH_AS_0500]|uniref:hypothetical protein n=1 Tax=Siphonobacter sp. SORGH_AS_0500 TaxID=1864824 RepID=UPI000CC2630B|nr:hypothetical protein [Siphonobacter sp. SORGH_AS_0500]PKK36532.1 hypothetical protein BWI96_11805 [Siphonobacter sp. SORGH_AS_0500]